MVYSTTDIKILNCSCTNPTYKTGYAKKAFWSWWNKTTYRP